MAEGTKLWLDKSEAINFFIFSNCGHENVNTIIIVCRVSYSYYDKYYAVPRQFRLFQP